MKNSYIDLLKKIYANINIELNHLELYKNYENTSVKDRIKELISELNDIYKKEQN